MRSARSTPSRLPNMDFREFLGGAIIALSGMMSARRHIAFADKI